MKKLLSILLAVLMLGGIMMVATSAAPGIGLSSAVSLTDLTKFLKNADLKNLTKQEINWLVGGLEFLKFVGIDYKAALNSVRGDLPISVKAALHKAGVMSYPIWERNVFFNIIFKVFLFGWIWM